MARGCVAEADPAGPGAGPGSAPAVAVLIPAAGASARMRGRDKLLEPVEGVPLLRRIAAAALASGLPVTVVLPPDRPDRAAALDGLALRRVVAADAALGLGATLRAGVAALPGVGAIIVLLADLPEITAADLRRLADAHDPGAGDAAPILRATAEDGTPGHPVLFPAWAHAALAGLSGDAGAGALLRRWHDRVVPVALPGRRAVTDLDTPEAWAAWRAAR
jgi:CTP:molybdopterin cytidylyltransferase MocA